jgi:RHS repeat-associated protein
VQWPGWNATAWSQEAEKPATVGSERFWFGSLSVGMRDASGQLYMRNRYYNPQTGQFTQPDPIGLAGGLNSYGFAAGDPVSYSDPYGLSAEECPPVCRITDWGGGGTQQSRGLGHIRKRHVNGRIGNQFVDMDDRALRHVISQTVEGGEMVAEQIGDDGGRRFVFERRWGQIGTKGERIARVVIGESGELLTAFPVRNAMRVAGAGAAASWGARALRWTVRAAAVATVVGAMIDVAISPSAAGSTNCTGVCQE